MNDLRKWVLAQFIFNVIAWAAVGYWIYAKAEAAQADSGDTLSLQQDLVQVAARLESTDKLLGETRGRVEYIKENLGSVATYEARVIALEKEFERWEIEDRLFRDEVRGRIWDIPYTLPGDRASANR